MNAKAVGDTDTVCCRLAARLVTYELCWSWYVVISPWSLLWMPLGFSNGLADAAEGRVVQLG
jgi:hypothetical protein